MGNLAENDIMKIIWHAFRVIFYLTLNYEVNIITSIPLLTRILKQFLAYLSNKFIM